jgi:hypothetical protein
MQSFNQSQEKRCKRWIFLKTQRYGHFDKEVLEMSWDTNSKESGTYKEHTLVSFLNWQTFQRTVKLHTKHVRDYKPHKNGNEWVQLTVGGDILDYSGDIATSTMDITTFEILINGTLSTEDAEMKMDIKNYYLDTL